MNDVLPLPEAPQMAILSPAAMDRLTLDNAAAEWGLIRRNGKLG